MASRTSDHVGANQGGAESEGFLRVQCDHSTQDDDIDAVVLVHDREVELAELVALKSALVARGSRVRLEQRPKNLKPLLDRATADGYTHFAAVRPGATIDTLELKQLG